MKRLGSDDLQYFLKNVKEDKALDKDKLLELLGAATESMAAIVTYVEAEGEDPADPDPIDPADDVLDDEIDGSDPAKGYAALMAELKDIKI